MKTTVNILGTEYKINKYNFTDKPEFEKRSIDGYCDSELKEIAYINMKTYPGWEFETEEYCSLSEKQTIRHEISHAFLNESGLRDSSSKTQTGWAKNEEMVDWFAIQAPKIFKVYQELEIL
jgi:hypothetical protein